MNNYSGMNGINNYIPQQPQGFMNPQQYQMDSVMQRLNNMQQNNQQQQAIMQPQPQQAQQPVNGYPFVMVEDIDKAQRYSIQNNQTLWMRDSVKPYIYVKTVDVTGAPDFKVLEVREVTNEVLGQSNDGISKDDFNRLFEKIGNIENTMVDYGQTLTSHQNMFNQLLTPIEPKEQPIVEEKKTTRGRGSSTIQKAGE